MSDDFDKEAEREKLREKYAEEEQDRAATQQMSELLLQGATMTNAHCDEHGDPIFRYDGEEFCPTCRQEGRSQGGAAGQTDDATNQQAGGQPQTGQQAGGRAATGSQPSPDQTGGQQPDAQEIDVQSPDAGQTDQATTEPARGASSSQSVPAAQSTPDRQSSTGGQPVADSGTSVPDGATLDDATASLVAALKKHADRAAATDDPRTAKESLAAAREAAEALAALRR